MKYSLISKYRSVLMGFATLWIAFLHAQMWFRNPILSTLSLLDIMVLMFSYFFLELVYIMPIKKHKALRF